MGISASDKRLETLHLNLFHHLSSLAVGAYHIWLRRDESLDGMFCFTIIPLSTFLQKEIGLTSHSLSMLSIPILVMTTLVCHVSTKNPL